MDSLPLEIVGQIVNYLEFEDAFRFELLSKNCGYAIKRYFDDTEIDFDLDISTNICNEFVFKLLHEGTTIAKFIVHYNGKLENIFDKCRITLPESESNQLDLLKSVFRWIQQNTDAIHSKWESKSEPVPNINEIELGGYELYYIPEKAVERLAEAIVSEKVSARYLTVGDGFRDNIYSEVQFANVLHRNNLAQDVELKINIGVPSGQLILLAQEWTDCALAAQTERCLMNNIYGLIRDLKEAWLSRKNNTSESVDKKPWSLTFQMDLQYSPRYTDKEMEEMSKEFSDESFSLSFRREPRTEPRLFASSGDEFHLYAEIKGM